MRADHGIPRSSGAGAGRHFLSASLPAEPCPGLPADPDAGYQRHQGALRPLGGGDRPWDGAAGPEDCWGPGGPDLLVVAPPAIRPEVEHSPVAAAMGRGCAEKSRQLAEHYRRLAARLGARFLDGEGCELNRVDHMHLTQAGHAQLAARVGAVLSDPATGALGQ